MKGEIMKVVSWIIDFIVTVAIVFGVEAGTAEILHLIFPSILSFWRWFGVVFLSMYALWLIGRTAKNSA